MRLFAIWLWAAGGAVAFDPQLQQEAATLKDVAKMIQEADLVMPPPGTALLCWRYTDEGTQLYAPATHEPTELVLLDGARGESVDAALTALHQKALEAPTLPPASLFEGDVPTDALWVSPCEPLTPSPPLELPAAHAPLAPQESP
jgi:hypothetical protein